MDPHPHPLFTAATRPNRPSRAVFPRAPAVISSARQLVYLGRAQRQGQKQQGKASARLRALSVICSASGAPSARVCTGIFHSLPQREGRAAAKIKRKFSGRMDADQDSCSGNNGNTSEGGDVYAASGDQKAVLKLLVANSVAGSIIGKGGSTISEFQQSSQARIQLSRAGEYFPATKERIAVISGTLHAVLTAVHLVLGKVREETVGSGADEEGSEEDEALQVKLCIPIRLCGAIIGKGGGTVRAFMDDCKADIRIQGQESLLPGVSERLVTVRGTTSQIMRAFGLILSKLSEDPKYDEYAEQPVSPGSRFRNGGGPQATHMNQIAPLANANTTMVLDVSNLDAGAVLGRRGRNIAEITQVSGARVKVSDRDDINQDLGTRKVTITGTLEAVNIAMCMVCQKVGSSDNGRFNGGRRSN